MILDEGQWNNHWVGKSKQFMDQHFSKPISIEDVAVYTSIHRTQLHKIFVRQFGCSPIVYLQKLRLENAAKLLGETRIRVNLIALAVGYPDLGSFSRAYRKFYGVSPTEYRRNRLNDRASGIES